MRTAQSRFTGGQFVVLALELFLEVLALRDVPKNALSPERASERVADGRLHHLHKDRLPGRRNILLDRLQDAAGADDFAVVLLVFGGKLRRVEIEIRAADDFIKTLPEQLAEALIGEGEALLQILLENILRQMLDQRMVKRLRANEPFLGLPSFDGVADGAAQPVTIEPAFHQIILRSFAHRADGERLVVGTAEHDHGQVRHGALHGLKCLQPFAVREGQISENDVEPALLEMVQSVGKPFSLRDRERRSGHLAQQLPQQAGVRGIILDEQDMDEFHACCSADHPPVVVPSAATPARCHIPGLEQSF